MNTPTEQRIRFWRRRQAAAAEQAVERTKQWYTERDQADVPAGEVAAHIRHILNRHEEKQLPVGMLFDSINEECLGRPPAVAELLAVAGMGIELLYSALLGQRGSAAHDAFLDLLRREWGAVLVDAALAEYDALNSEDEAYGGLLDSLRREWGAGPMRAAVAGYDPDEDEAAFEPDAEPPF